MLFETMGQGLLFLWMMAAGAAVFGWYLICCGLRRLVQAGTWLGLGCDLLFGFGAAAILIAALVAGNYGSVRPFALLGAACGAGICAAGVLPPLQALGRKLGALAGCIVKQAAQNRLLKIIFK